MRQALYMPSTPLNTLMSVAHAASCQNLQNARLWLIDQKYTGQNPYYEVLNQSGLSLFDDIQCFEGKKIGLAKLQERYQFFKEFRELLADIMVTDIFVGSDRRIEFQFLMHWLSKKNPSLKGHYLDDGLYSYAGKPRVWYKDTINSLVKKLLYGFWWQEPKTIGASDWINDVWVMDTGLLDPALKQKNLHQLAPELFVSSEVQKFSQQLLTFFGEQIDTYQEIDTVIILPHPNNIKKMAGYEIKLKQLIQKTVSTGGNLAVKYHPRMGQDDALSLASLGVKKIIPTSIAFEFILPLLKKDAQLIADVGSVLFMAKKLRPDLKSLAILDKDDVFQRQFLKLFQRAGIQIKSPEDVFG